MWSFQNVKKYLISQLSNNLISEKVISQQDTTDNKNEIENSLRDLGIDIQTPYFDNTTEIDFLSANPNARELFSDLGTIMFFIKERLMLSNDVEIETLKNKLSDHYVGIIIDKSASGVHFSVDTFNSFTLNPFTIRNFSIDRLTEHLYNIIIHEITHAEVSPHNERFILKQNEISSYLAEDRFNYYIKDLIYQTLEQHWQTYLHLNVLYQKLN
jgi:hypothetical protein